MTSESPRRLLFIAAALAFLGLATAAGAEECRNGCTSGQRVCTMQTRIALLGCLRSCAANDSQCGAACAGGYRASRSACRAARSDCSTTCPQAQPASASEEADSCGGACGTTARACFSGALSEAKSCVTGCIASDGSLNESCMKRCATGIGSRKATCLASMQSCLGECHGPVTGTCFSTVDMQCTAEPCDPGHPCSQTNEFCSERCAAPPPAGTCFDRETKQCTDQACSSAQPCADGQTCMPVCPPPGPQQKCFDTTTKQCTDQPCDAAHPCDAATQICTLQCPPPPSKGTCFDTSAMQCLDQTCSHDQPCAQPNQRCLEHCPPPTPVPPCSAVPCGGPCAISPVCPPGQACPEHALRGECAADDAGNCGCVPVSPPPTRTPKPTPAPPCDSAACGGPCALSLPCLTNAPCDGEREKVGQCVVIADGSCACVPPTPPPRPTRTPQCGDATCGGPCEIGPPDCVPGQPCAEYPTRRGQCTADDQGGCSCVPVSPPPTRTPRPTPVQCDAAACGGACALSSCPANVPCDDVADKMGQCQVRADGSCGCVPVQPTPRATPTPQCGGATCGGPCEVGPSNCVDGQPCPESASRRGQCVAGDQGNCRCVPVSPPPTRTPNPTPPSPCDSAACGGPCTASSSFQCPPNALCKDLPGECTITANGGCECIPLRPSPPPTATPQCGGATCGGECEISSSACPPGANCPDGHRRRGQCSPDDAGNCRCVPSSPPPTASPATPPHPCDANACDGRCFVPFPCPDGVACPAVVLPGKCTKTANGGCDCVPVND